MGDEGTCGGGRVRRGEHSVLNSSDTNDLSKHVFSEVLYHVGPVDYCSAISPATQDLSLEHLGVVAGRTNSQTNFMSCVSHP